MKILTKLLALPLLGFGAPCIASPLYFDCDVPAGHYSTLKQAFSGKAELSGSARFIEYRKHQNPTVASAALISADKKTSVGFQLVMPSKDSRAMFVYSIVAYYDRIDRKMIGQLLASDVATFELGLDTAGLFTLKVGSVSYQNKAEPIAEGNASVFCGSGQFKFDELNLPGN